MAQRRTLNTPQRRAAPVAGITSLDVRNVTVAIWSDDGLVGPSEKQNNTVNRPVKIIMFQTYSIWTWSWLVLLMARSVSAAEDILCELDLVDSQLGEHTVYTSCLDCTLTMLVHHSNQMTERAHYVSCVVKTLNGSILEMWNNIHFFCLYGYISSRLYLTEYSIQ